MKQRSLSISIPKPCYEKWEKMSKVEQGRHCQSCQKTVVDFTRMPKVKIAEFISANEGNLCGRFTSDQLNVELIPPKPTRSWIKYAAIILGLIPTLGCGQEVVKDTTTATPQIIENIKIGKVIEKNIPERGEIKVNSPAQSVQSKIVKGTVLDSNTGEAILFGSVAINKDGKILTGVQTDLDGRFTLEIPEGSVIEASYNGYETKTIKYNDIHVDQDLIIPLKVADFLGEIVVVGLYLRQPIENEKSKNENSKKVEKDSTVEIQEIDNFNSKVYPNPGTGIFNVEIPGTIENFDLVVTDVNNDLILSIDNAQFSGAVDLSDYASGTYIISIVSKGRLVHSKMVIKI